MGIASWFRRFEHYWLWRVIHLSMKRTLLAATVSFTVGLIFLAAR